LIYELLISTTSSYFLGDSVKQFSLTIGVYMAAMGVGSFLSKYIHDDLLEWFIKFDLINIALGLIVYRFFTQYLSVVKKRWLEIATILCIVFFILMGVYSGKLLQHWEDNFYTHQIIYFKQTPYQKLIVTKNNDDLRLYINRVIQFSSRDEYRYHEALALVPLHIAPHKKKY